MGKIKLAVKSPHVDMTPMVDLFSLLLVFFILTATFRPEEAAPITTPSSISQTPIPDNNLLTLEISKDGRVFFNVDNGSDTTKHIRGKILRAMGSQYSIAFTPVEVKKFEALAAFGVPIIKMKDFINAENSSIRSALQVGIPTDSTDNQLLMWIRQARLYNNDIQVAIKGDANTNYPVVKKVIDILQDNNVNKFNLTTNPEANDIQLDENL
jgi:biopolymer transport protein ExbD